MAGLKATYDIATLQMALVGYQHEREKIDEKIREIQAQLKGKAAAPSVAGERPAVAPKRVLSVAARRRIALAQKKRWAEHRRRKAQAKPEEK
jgi:hypothetical protein